MRAFKDRLKQEMKIMKQEMDMLPRQQRKDALRMKKDQMEHENHMKASTCIFILLLESHFEAVLQSGEKGVLHFLTASGSGFHNATPKERRSDAC